MVTEAKPKQEERPPVEVGPKATGDPAAELAKRDATINGLQRQLSGKDKQLAVLNEKLATVTAKIADLERAELDPEDRKRLQDLDEQRAKLESDRRDMEEARQSFHGEWTLFNAEKLSLQHGGVPIDILLAADEQGNPPSLKEMEIRALREENKSLKASTGDKKPSESPTQKVYDQGTGSEVPPQKGPLNMTPEEFRKYATEKHGWRFD